MKREKSIPAVVELFRANGRVLSTEVAGLTGDYQGADAVTAMRLFGLEIVAVGFVPGSKQRKLYELRNLERWVDNRGYPQIGGVATWQRRNFSNE